MSTPTSRLCTDLKERIKKAAERAYAPTDSFIADTMAEMTDSETRHADFHDTANRRYTKIAQSGMAIAWTEMRRYLLDRAAQYERYRHAQQL